MDEKEYSKKKTMVLYSPHMELIPIDIRPEAKPRTESGFLRVPPEALKTLAEAAFTRMAFTFSEDHLRHLSKVALDDKNSPNDRMVASALLENAIIASDCVFPHCQDTGTAQVFGWRDSRVLVEGDDRQLLAEGALAAYLGQNLRYSTTIPSSLFEERDPGNNMPAQVLIEGTYPPPGAEAAYRFLFCAKGGGSSNKTKFFQVTKGMLNEKAFTAFLEREIAALGTAACPPYTIAVVVGGISPEQNLLALKLATAGLYDFPHGEADHRVMGVAPLRSPQWEERVLSIAEKTGLGAQFGGRALAVDSVVLRLPRHGASCPLSIGVSCAAHRNLFGRIDSRGVFLEATADPRDLEEVRRAAALYSAPAGALRMDLDRGVEALRSGLKGLKPGTPVLVSGSLLVARDAAHARWKALVESGGALPDYVSRYPILYAGPAKTPEGKPTGSLGPTTAGRMDDYADFLMSRGAALVTVAKGNRGDTWIDACKRYGGFYLGTMGGAAALLASRHVLSSRVEDYGDLGMEAVRLIEVRDLPLFLVTNDLGQDLYRNAAATQGETP